RKRGRVPGPLRRAMGALLGASATRPGRGAWRGKVAKLGELMQADTRGEFYRQFVSYWKDPGRVVIGGVEPESLFEQPMQGSAFDVMMKLDSVTYLPDDILVKVRSEERRVGKEGGIRVSSEPLSNGASRGG